MQNFSGLDHEHFMRAALIEAGAAGEAGDKPIGAVLVCGDEIVARGRNRTHSNRNCRAHAEIDALDNAIAIIETRPAAIAIYTTMEPCAMCLGALAVAEIRAVVFGMSDPARGGTEMIERVSFVRSSIEHYVGGVLAPSCEELWERFAGK